ncbi:MAG: tetratricopeptide repeat protein, partial [Rhodanobacteraceae bacterium]
ISVCPNDALYNGFGKPALGLSKANKPPAHYSLTWPEEILGIAVFLGSFLAVRNVYGLVPFLMALGCAAVTTFLFLKAWRVLATHDVYFHRFHLKSGGHIRRGGWALLVVAFLWIGLTIQSGWIRWQEHEGDQAFQHLQIPDELALAQLNPAPWLSPTDQANIRAGREHLGAANRFGLFQNDAALAKLAWFDYLAGDPQLAARQLAQAAAAQKGEARALSLYYRGAILNRLGRLDEAAKTLDAALVERPDLLLARQEKGESLWRLGRKTEAVDTWREALRSNPKLVLTNEELAGAARNLGHPDQAAAFEEQATAAAPNDPLYHWMLGLRLRNVGMQHESEQQFARARQLDPRYATAPR